MHPAKSRVGVGVIEGVGVGGIGEEVGVTEGVQVAEGVDITTGLTGKAVGKGREVAVAITADASETGPIGVGAAGVETKADKARLSKMIIRPRAIKILNVIISPALAEPSSLGG